MRLLNREQAFAGWTSAITAILIAFTCKTDLSAIFALILIGITLGIGIGNILIEEKK